MWHVLGVDKSPESCVEEGKKNGFRSNLYWSHTELVHLLQQLKDWKSRDAGSCICLVSVRCTVDKNGCKSSCTALGQEAHFGQAQSDCSRPSPLLRRAQEWNATAAWPNVCSAPLLLSRPYFFTHPPPGLPAPHRVLRLKWKKGIKLCSRHNPPTF